MQRIARKMVWCGPVVWLLIGCVLLNMLFAGRVWAQDSECAEVKIVIEQKLSLERQAFDARMVIRNGLEDKALENVAIALTFADQDNNEVVATTDPNAVGAVFFSRTDSLDGIAALDGSASIAPKTAAEVHWLIIPSAGAGGTTSAGKLYYIGAKVTYTLNGQTSTVEVSPDYVIVKPQPLLKLDYFLPTDVYADDPFTLPVEPSEPFTLGVRIANVGAGTAVKTSIESAQPKIVENRQGLLIGFKINGGFVNNEPAGQSLLLNFGDIAAHSAKMGRWQMETTLAGRFVEFNASFTHADALGGAVTSLIQEVNTHTLVHDVQVDLAGRDEIGDYLAVEGNGLRVYESDGGDWPVLDRSSSASLQASGANRQSLRFTPIQGLVHAKVADPYRGAKTPTQVLRSDGKNLLPANFWLSKTRLADLSWSYFVHVFDADSTGQYTLVFSEGSTASLSGQAYQDVNANGLRDSAEPAAGNLAITLTGLDAQGRNVNTVAYTNPQGEFAYVGLEPGQYQLQAAAWDNWVDGVWLAGSAGGSAVPGQISQIVLLAGTNAQGYLLAKRRPVPGEDNPTNAAAQADVAVQLQTSVQQLEVGQSVELRITASNAGPANAQGVNVYAAVPAGFSLQNTQVSPATAGSYAAGQWSLGNLAKDQSAILTLTLRADAQQGADPSQGTGADTAVALLARIGASERDPQANNNSANATLLLSAPSQAVQMSQSLPTQSRVLVVASCGALQAQAQGQSVDECAQSKAQVAQSWMLAQGLRSHSVVDATQLRQALRGGIYNTVWLSGGAALLDATLQAELRAAVRRGHALVLEGIYSEAVTPDSSLASLADVIGLAFSASSVGQDLELAIAQANASPELRASKGPAWALQPAAGALVQAQAQFTGTQHIAMAQAQFGQGQTWTLGFDVLASLQDSSDPARQAVWSAHVKRQLQSMVRAPQASATEPELAGAYVALQTHIEHRGNASSPAVAAMLHISVPNNVGTSDAAPAPASTETQGAQQQHNWSVALNPGEQKTWYLGLRLPAQSGQSSVPSTLSDGSTANALGQASQTLHGWAADVIVPNVDAGLARLSHSEAAAQAHISQARSSAQAAQAAQAQTPGSATQEQVLTHLADLQGQLDSLAAQYPALASQGLSELQLDVARWIGVAQLQWQASPPIAPPASPASLERMSGTPQTATVEQAFAQALQVKVLDANNQPLAGVSVDFNVPVTAANAASAYFGSTASPSLSARVVTNAQGLASAPSLTANAVVGSYQVSARIAGAQHNAIAAVQFSLSNQAAVVVPPPPAGSTSFSGMTTTGTGRVTASISGGGASCVFNPSATSLQPAQGVLPFLNQVLLPHGVFSFELQGCAVGGTVTVTTTWPNLNGITGYLKYGPTYYSGAHSVWYLPRNLRINLATNTISYTIQDGGLGDDDRSANGIIKDPGGPVIDNRAGGGAGSVNAIPALSVWSLAWLGSLMLLGTWWLRRRVKGPQT